MVSTLGRVRSIASSVSSLWHKRGIFDVRHMCFVCVQEATYSAVSPLSGPPPQRSYARTAAFLSAGLATVCVVALAVHSAERGGLSANSDTSLAITKALRGFGGMHTYYRSGEFGQTRQLTLSKHLQSLQGANTTGNATDTSFDLSAWLDSQPKGTW